MLLSPRLPSCSCLGGIDGVESSTLEALLYMFLKLGRERGQSRFGEWQDKNEVVLAKQARFNRSQAKFSSAT